MLVRRLSTSTSIIAVMAVALSMVAMPLGGAAFAAPKTHVLDSLLTVTSIRYSPQPR